MIDTVGCAVNFGPVRAWWRRSLIERIFGELTRKGLQRQLDVLERAVHWLTHQRGQARQEQRFGDLLRHTRNQALLLIGFWRGFRSDELTRLDIEWIDVAPGDGMTIWLPRTKTDRNLKGSSYRTPALSRLCPVAAYLDWLAVSGLKSGPVFRGVDRWGQIKDLSINSGSIIPLLRRILQAAEVADVHLYSSHSLRRGFATWASANGWELRHLMEYVGWKNVASVTRYIDTNNPFHQSMLERMMPSIKSDQTSPLSSEKSHSPKD